MRTQAGKKALLSLWSPRTFVEAYCFDNALAIAHHTYQIQAIGQIGYIVELAAVYAIVAHLAPQQVVNYQLVKACAVGQLEVISSRIGKISDFLTSNRAEVVISLTAMV